jgi:crotonobetainyl-CoA:carnitine CoA-transferase CaiB-like acyl-CoA transferase
MTPGRLHGVKVIECCSFVAGPYFGKLFADPGAEVIKIEMPGEGDIARTREPFFLSAGEDKGPVLGHSSPTPKALCPGLPRMS